METVGEVSMEQQDEVFESIPWERFGEMQRGADRRWVGVALAVIAVGVGAMVLRAAPAAVPAVAAPVTTASTSAPTTTPSPSTTVASLWASEASLVDGRATAERFAFGLFGSQDGVAVAGVRASSATSGGGVVEVDLLLVGADGASQAVRLGVEVGAEGDVLRWYPLPIDPVAAHTPAVGAEPPPDVLSELVRMAARWGTTVDVLASGLADDRWWANVRVELPEGMIVSVMVWED